MNIVSHEDGTRQKIEWLLEDLSMMWDEKIAVVRNP